VAKQGTIADVQGLGSGLVSLIMTDSSIVHLEGGFGARQMAQVLGQNPKSWVGREIEYTTDDLDVMASFEPVD